MVTPWILEPAAAPGGPWPWWPPGTAGALGWLHRHGLAGTTVGLAALDRPATAALLVAAPLAGTVPVLLNRRLDAATLAAQAHRAGALRILGHDGHPLAADLVLPDAFEDDPAPAPRTPAGEDPVAVLFTAGTTGTPRPVVLRWRQVRHGAAASVIVLGLGRGDRWCACLPLDHIAGAMAVWRAALAGAALHLHPRFEPVAVADDLDRCTGASLVPTQLHRLMALGRTWRGPRTILVGGAACAPDLAGAATAAGLPVRTTWALSECAGTVCIDGQALPGLVVDLDGDRLRVSGPTTPDGAPFTTGDLGAIGVDGLVRVLGRADEAITCGGEKIRPEPVESWLLAQPGIRDACVCGEPDPEWGERVVAWLVGDGREPDWMALPPLWRPKAWRWVDAIPATPLGKRARRALGTAFSRPSPGA
ncbi:MAG: hypothetical protein RLZZ127_1366 [Planctomycetota bacterium]|jgi:O-succinylbenzoic acid--CoA ligase